MEDETSATTTANNNAADDWDEISVNPHKSSIDQGRKEGRTHGRDSGYNEGYTVGVTTALNHGLELGFIDAILQSIRTNDRAAKRWSKSILAIETLIQSFLVMDETKLIRREDDDNEKAKDNETSNVSNNEDNKQANEDEKSIKNDDDDVDAVKTLRLIQTRFKLLMVQIGLPHFSLTSIMTAADPQQNSSGNDGNTLGYTDW